MLALSKNGLASVTHDGYGYLSRGYALANDNCELYPNCGCEKRCLAIDQVAEEIETELMSLPHVEPCDLFLVQQFCKLLMFQTTVDRYLEKNGILKQKNGQTTFEPVFRDYFMISNSLQRLADRLGLSPTGRKQLQSKGHMKDLAAAIAELGDKKK